MPRQRLIVATLLFLGAFAVIAQLAWNTAIATNGPWFSPAISRDVYSTTMIAATVLVAVLAALASGQSASAARDARALDLRFNILRGRGSLDRGNRVPRHRRGHAARLRRVRGKPLHDEYGAHPVPRVRLARPRGMGRGRPRIRPRSRGQARTRVEVGVAASGSRGRDVTGRGRCSRR